MSESAPYLRPHRAVSRWRGVCATVTAVLLVGASADVLHGQRPVDAKTEGVARSRDIANAILHWVTDFRTHRFSLQSRLLPTVEAHVEFIRLGVRAGALVTGEKAALMSNFAVLQRLVVEAEKHPSAAVADALMALASIGLENDMFDHKLRVVRELGHFAILRIEAASVWNRVHGLVTTAPTLDGAGEEIESAAEKTARQDSDRPFIPLADRAIWRIAAVRLLGLKGRGVFRSSIEKCLGHADGRVRLAAAESLTALHHHASLPTVTRVLSGESHPMVVVALLQAMQQILNKQAQVIPAARSALGLRTALGRLGQVGWRSDMAIVQLLHNHPIRQAVPSLIALMRHARGDDDPILKIINGNASRFLGLQAHRALRKITGALIPDDPDKWEEFWLKEQDKIVVRRTRALHKTRTVAAVTSGGSFYGIPVLGSDVVFVLDTSGSMKQPVKRVLRGPVTGPRKGSKLSLSGTRLQVARRQTLKAVQGMPKNAKFSIVTFSGNVRAWNRVPAKAGRSARYTAARILGRLRPKGGTNVFEALIYVLEGRNVGYGSGATKSTDEVFILSDGMPSAGELTRPEEILEVVREINKLRKVRINTVFAGSGSGAAFMKQLAEENGGVFVQQ